MDGSHLVLNGSVYCDFGIFVCLLVSFPHQIYFFTSHKQIFVYDYSTLFDQIIC